MERVMTARRTSRASDSPLVERITEVVYEARTEELSTPDGCWDIVVQRHAGKITMLQTGVITRPVVLPYDAGDEYVSISFKPGVFMPRLPG